MQYHDPDYYREALTQLLYGLSFDDGNIDEIFDLFEPEHYRMLGDGVLMELAAAIDESDPTHFEIGLN